MTTSSGFVAPSPEAECDVAVAQNSFKLNAATHELSWDTCEWAAQQTVEHRVGVRTLDDGAFAAIATAYEKVVPNEKPECLVDAGGATLEVVSHGERSFFVDDWTSGCSGAARERVAVKGLAELRAAMSAAR